ncbi:MAG TPA: hypothetical protein VFR68_15145 [Candidatus Dormibacteraeota bacterium]|nr:hypothetical protein [Candidatus Dormibacteraeota bacterium]
MSVFIFDRHGIQELPTANTIVRTGPLVRAHIEKRKDRGHPPVAIIHLADDTIVSLVQPENHLRHDPQSWPRHADQAPGVYVRLHGVTHAFPAATYGGVTYRLVDDDAFIEVFSADFPFISNFLESLDKQDVPAELLLAVLRFAPGVIVGDGSKGAMKAVEGDPTQSR